MTASSTAGHPPALVIGGMHRSGTSLTASIVAAAGIHLGDDLMAAGAVTLPVLEEVVDHWLDRHAA